MQQEISGMKTPLEMIFTNLDAIIANKKSNYDLAQAKKMAKLAPKVVPSQNNLPTQNLKARVHRVVYDDMADEETFVDSEYKDETQELLDNQAGIFQVGLM
jgi:hypothetical protein